MSRDRDELLERLSKCIETAQKFHNDSRTPLDHAKALIEPIRILVHCRDALRNTAFEFEPSDEFSKAISRLAIINNTLKADVIAHHKTMDFVKDAALAAAAVADFAAAIGAVAA